MSRKVLLMLAVVFLLPSTSTATEIETLPGTLPLEWTDDLAFRMMDGLHRFADRKIADSAKSRPAFWKRDPASREAYEKSIEPNRARFKKIIGVVDERVTPRMERFGDDDNPALVAETEEYRVFQVRWQVFGGITGEGLLLEPKGTPRSYVVALPDADQTPEQLVGLAPGIEPASQFARHLALSGSVVVVPTLIDRSDRWSGSPLVAYTNQPHREWIYRQAYHMGRHIIGYEVQKVLAVIDWFERTGADGKIPDVKTAVAGYGEGGMLAFFSAAVDPRIDACLVSGYFEPHAQPWDEPLYRNVWSYLHEFGDAEVATLIAPRTLVLEYSKVPAVAGPPAVQKGRRGGAALGRLVTPPHDSVKAEFDRIDQLLPFAFRQGSPVESRSHTLIAGKGGEPVSPGSPAALTAFTQRTPIAESALSPVQDRRETFVPAERQRRQVQELEAHVQLLVRGSDNTRAEFATKTFGPPPQKLEQFAAQSPAMKKYLWEEVFGKIEDRPLPLNPRSRKIYDKEKWVGYEVVLDVFPDVFAWGVLLLPKDLKPGERRPVVVCQHGRQGIPSDVIEGDKAAYHDFAARLAERGFITFAPHNSYRGEDRYRVLSRKANSVKGSLFSFILAQHEQILTYLGGLPFVDPQRIAFYGLSYGGETAVRVPPLLERYALSICSADFNDWVRKVASTDARYTFMFTVEWEMPYFNMGSTFNYADMAQLMLPRPFMVERGHADGVAPDEWVAYEYAKVRRIYDLFALGDKTEMEVFNGGHTINGQGTFRFLEKHLVWPARQ